LDQLHVYILLSSTNNSEVHLDIYCTWRKQINSNRTDDVNANDQLGWQQALKCYCHNEKVRGRGWRVCPNGPGENPTDRIYQMVSRKLDHFLHYFLHWNSFIKKLF